MTDVFAFLEKFNIQLSPVPMTELVQNVVRQFGPYPLRALEI